MENQLLKSLADKVGSVQGIFVDRDSDFLKGYVSKMRGITGYKYFEASDKILALTRGLPRARSLAIMSELWCHGF